MNESKKISEELLDKIISVAYSDAGLFDRIKIYFAAKNNSKVKKILDEFRLTAGEIHLLKEDEYRGKILLNQTSAGSPRSGAGRWALKYFEIFIKRPIISTAVTLLLIGSVSTYYLVQRKNAEQTYSRAELIKAKMQAEESFAIVASIMNKAEGKLTNDVLEKKVNRPIQKSLTIINSYLTGG